MEHGLWLVRLLLGSGETFLLSLSHVYSKNRAGWAWAVLSAVKCLPGKHEDRGLGPWNSRKKLGVVTSTVVSTGEAEIGSPQGSCQLVQLISDF